ncbi:hypothetical protein HYR99_20225 [Candidatus Poribacteria bacterium]|nr:hypothetical protein [Candidatus Poribacteria bacterium]
MKIKKGYIPRLEDDRNHPMPAKGILFSYEEQSVTLPGQMLFTLAVETTPDFFYPF